jgi:hypothetical protein
MDMMTSINDQKLRQHCIELVLDRTRGRNVTIKEVMNQSDQLFNYIKNGKKADQ